MLYFSFILAQKDKIHYALAYLLFLRLFKLNKLHENKVSFKNKHSNTIYNLKLKKN